MNKKEAKKLFKKYVNNECSAEEQELLDIFFNSYQGKNNNWVESLLGDEEVFKKNSWLSIESKIYKRKKKSHFLKSYLKYAAVAVIFIGLGFVCQKIFFPMHPQLVIPDENITIQLDNGNIEIIKEEGSLNVVDKNGNLVGTQKGSQLIYRKEAAINTKTEELVYNTLRVPYGKHFEIVLSDSTIVNLNAGSSLKYPVEFVKGQHRQVFLKGEAYFNVKKNYSSPFIVNSNEINIRVLGTQFNVSSYPEDNNINTVLVEGSVSIYEKEVPYTLESSVILTPGLKASWNKNQHKINIEKADIEMHTAWLDGKIIFRHTTFNNIIKKLERHYNVEITNNNSELGKKYIAASFDIETIEEVFEVFKEYYGISYTIINNQIIIN
ncbi:FecR family protein [Abyssalbus ytuae]|uniref:FecR domain-containing protein n=1 Tax=Abyssalbus ytuae TaxID=2926907 RepID=A0A9E6ZMB5_9FLAO|nr:FecR domain-containing protein [Abyssalbus ytuae]UOB18464.1 FecR domain-containing protein [Abyssalbus ytuae]